RPRCLILEGGSQRARSQGFEAIPGNCIPISFIPYFRDRGADCHAEPGYFRCLGRRFSSWLSSTDRVGQLDRRCIACGIHRYCGREPNFETNANRRLMWHGTLLFLLGLVTGLTEQRFTDRRMGLAAHLEGVMNGTFSLL